MMKRLVIFNIFFTILFTQVIFSVVEKEDASPEYIEKYYQKALEEYQKQHYKKSLDHIRHVIKSDMTNYKLRFLAAHDHWRLKNFDSAFIHFNTALKAKPLEIGTYIDLGLFLIQQNKYKQAKKVILSGIEILEKNNKKIPSKFYIILGRISFYQYQFENALLYIQKAKELFSNEGIKDQLETILIEGRIYLATNKFEQAEISLNWALSLKKNNPTASNLLGYIYEQWSNKETDTKKSNELRKKAAENYKIAMNIKGVPASLKKLIQENLKRVE